MNAPDVENGNSGRLPCSCRPLADTPDPREVLVVLAGRRHDARPEFVFSINAQNNQPSQPLWGRTGRGKRFGGSWPESRFRLPQRAVRGLCLGAGSVGCLCRNGTEGSGDCPIGECARSRQRGPHTSQPLAERSFHTDPRCGCAQIATSEF